MEQPQNYYQAHREHILAYRKEHYQRNKEKLRLQSRRYQLRKQGLTDDQIDNLFALDRIKLTIKSKN